jgi:nucleotidyltransferase/DNA polymerase involved in DNA repair
MTDDSTTSTTTDRRQPRLFDWTINLSHIGLVIGGIMVVIVFVSSIRDEIRQASADFRQVASEIRAENKLQDQSIGQLRLEALNNKADETTFRSDIRQNLNDLAKILTDIRIQSAKGNKP